METVSNWTMRKAQKDLKSLRVEVQQWMDGLSSRIQN